MRVLPMRVELQSLIYSLMAIGLEEMGKTGWTQTLKEADSWTRLDQTNQASLPPSLFLVEIKYGLKTDRLLA